MSNTRGILDSPAQAVNVLWHVIQRMTGLLVWTGLALFHIALLVMALLALWLTQTTPTDVALLAQTMIHTWPAAALGAVGVSAGTVAAAYWWVLKRLHAALLSPLAGHLLPKAGDPIGR